jgi:hypothetical protein
MWARDERPLAWWLSRLAAACAVVFVLLLERDLVCWLLACLPCLFAWLYVCDGVLFSSGWGRKWAQGAGQSEFWVGFWVVCQRVRALPDGEFDIQRGL